VPSSKGLIIWSRFNCRDSEEAAVVSVTTIYSVLLGESMIMPTVPFGEEIEFTLK
jgi:hypothetical protein